MTINFASRTSPMPAFSLFHRYAPIVVQPDLLTTIMAASASASASASSAAAAAGAAKSSSVADSLGQIEGCLIGDCLAVLIKELESRDAAQEKGFLTETADRASTVLIQEYAKLFIQTLEKEWAIINKIYPETRTVLAVRPEQLACSAKRAWNGTTVTDRTFVSFFCIAFLSSLPSTLLLSVDLL
jgi:hypothetical protein